MGAIAARLNSRGVPSPRQAKAHRTRRDGVGAGWDLSAVRVILTNQLYRGRLIWNRSRWMRLPGTRRRRRQLRPESEWVIVERPDLLIIEASLWHQAQARHAHIRAQYDHPSQFGKSRSEYGSHLLSGRLVCGECGGSLTIRTGKPSRYGCTRHWRRGSAACSNNILVRRDLAEQKIPDLLQAKLYTREGVRRLVEAVNARLRAARPATAAQREQLMQQLAEVRRRLEGLRRFVEHGDTSAKVRTWLGDAEVEEQRLEQEAERLGTQQRQAPIQIHPERVERYLSDLRERPSSRQVPGVVSSSRRTLSEL
jgi:site-specific DNA recombinase